MFRKIIIALAVCLLTLSCKLSKDDSGILPDSGDNEFLPDVEGPEKPKKPSSNGADENDLGGDQGDREGDGGNEDLDEDEGEEIDLAGYVTGTGANWESKCITMIFIIKRHFDGNLPVSKSRPAFLKSKGA